MVQKYVTLLADDFDQQITKDVETVTFSYNGKQYSVDLGPKNRKRLEKALEPFIDAAQASSTVRAIRSSTRVAVQGREKGQPSPATQIREWAKKQHIDVPPRGRISNDVIAKYAEYEKSLTHVG